MTLQPAMPDTGVEPATGSAAAAGPTILFDALSATEGGAVTYLRAFAARARDDAVTRAQVLFLVSRQDQFDELRAAGLRVERVAECMSPARRHLWYLRRVRDLIARHRIALWYFAGGVPPVMFPWGSCPSVLSFRNALPFNTMEIARVHGWRARLRLHVLRYTIVRGARRTSALLFVSNYGRDLLADSLGGSLKARSEVIHHGLDARPTGKAGSDDPGLLYVSFIDAYKRQIEVVEEYAVIVQRVTDAPRLTLVGSGDARYLGRLRERIEELKLGERVRVMSSVSHRDVLGMMAAARIAVFASVCENCPNILIEKLHAGLPVLCSDRPPMPEIGGDAAIYFDPDRPGSLTEAFVALYASPQRQRALAAAARLRAERFAFDITYRRTVDFLRSQLTLASE
jgi:glycosyltransferase involved in cell wall biosynthesis